jgi:hypothetical protein
MNHDEINFFGIHFSGPPSFVNTVFTLLLILFIGNAIGIYRDAKRRQKNPWIAIIFLSCGWPFSNIWWLWLRPPISKSHKDA